MKGVRKSRYSSSCFQNSALQRLNIRRRDTAVTSLLFRLIQGLVGCLDQFIYTAIRHEFGDTTTNSDHRIRWRLAVRIGEITQARKYSIYDYLCMLGPCGRQDNSGLQYRLDDTQRCATPERLPPSIHHLLGVHSGR